MNKKSVAALTSAMEHEQTDELVGVLTAISVVSRRLAKKLVLLEKQQSAVKKGKQKNEAAGQLSIHAD